MAGYCNSIQLGQLGITQATWTATRTAANGVLQIKTGAGYPAPATYANNNYFFLAAFFLATFFFAFFFAAIIVSLKLT